MSATRCIALLLPDWPADGDPKRFLPVVERIERLTPGVQIVRPGLCLVRSRGIERWFAGERPAAIALLDAVAETGAGAARAGVADGLFTAELAARRPIRPTDRLTVVPPGESAAFLSGIPVSALDDPDLASLLVRLGVRTLGAFAALPEQAVFDRFGERGERLRRLAGGLDSRPVLPRTPPKELIHRIDFDEPIETADRIAFSVRRTADAFVDDHTAALLVCTELLVTLVDAHGTASERLWLHPTAFDAAAIVDRVRWQLEAADGLEAGVIRVRLEPVAVDAIGHHEPGLFGPKAEARVHHAISRVQAMLGHESVLTATIGGGRWLAERQVLVPWGDRPPPVEPRDRPWPGSLPDPLPATVFPQLRPVDLVDAAGRAVAVSDRGAISAAPAVIVTGARRRRVIGWAGPWSIDERGWDSARHRRSCRFQVVDAEHVGWLLVLEAGGWWAEGRYD